MLQEQSFLYQTGARSYMKGFIDLTFLHNDHYYLLDWKLNLLSDYTPETLHKAMYEHSYYTQAEIYKTALERALKDHPFGNTFYFFLRGKEKGLLTL
jgi:exodeoxyribonuclease V beta subunit